MVRGGGDGGKRLSPSPLYDRTVVYRLPVRGPLNNTERGIPGVYVTHRSAATVAPK